MGRWLIVVGLAGWLWPSLSALAASAAVERCREMSVEQWRERSPQWKGRQLVAFASWCSSCKDKLIEARANPYDYILLAVFDDAADSGQTLRKLGISAECLHGDALGQYLGVQSLPWSQVIGGR